MTAPNGRSSVIAEEMQVGPRCARVVRIAVQALILEDVRRDEDANVVTETTVLRLTARDH